MIKRFHEAPLAIFDDVQKVTDGDYFLVHLFEENPAYKAKAYEAVAAGREVILDNSIFELGTAFDMKKFAQEVIDLKPTYYIVPDVLEDGEATCYNLIKWIFQFKSAVDLGTHYKSKMMATVQGKTYPEICECYKVLKGLGVEKIAIPFDLSFYEWLFQDDPRLIAWSKGRPQLIRMLLDDNVLDTRIPHHLLGCACIGEGQSYGSYTFIDSVDTSSPVVRGYLKDGYDDPVWGNIDKPSVKLYTLMDTEVGPMAKKCILDNIQDFEKWWSQDDWAN